MIDLDANSTGRPAGFHCNPDESAPAFWITRTDIMEEVAECHTVADGKYAMTHMLTTGEELGPLYLHGPGLDKPLRAHVGKDSGDVVIA